MKYPYLIILSLFFLFSGCQNYDDTYKEPDEEGVTGMEETDNELRDQEDANEDEVEVIE